MPTEAQRAFPARLKGVVTFSFSGQSFFVQDESAGIYIGSKTEGPLLKPGDLVLVEGVSDPGDYAPIVRSTRIEVLGHTNLPAARPASFQDLASGQEDSQWVEVSGLVRAVSTDSSGVQVLDLVSGGGRLTAFLSASVQSNLSAFVDRQVRVQGVCGSWFNRQRQLFGFRLLVPRVENIVVEETGLTNAQGQPPQAIGDLLRFSPRGAQGHRVKVRGTVVLQQRGRALVVQDDQHGLYVQTRQHGTLLPGDQVELLGFPATGDYTPILQDAAWRKIGPGPEPPAIPVRADEALAGLYDCRLVSIEGELLNVSFNGRETVLVMESDNRVFSAQLDPAGADVSLLTLRPQSRLRLTGVCRIQVGEEWRATPEWRAEAFRLLLRNTRDVKILGLPTWWTLPRLLWAVGILTAIGAGSLIWATVLRRKVRQQTTIIRRQLEQEGLLKQRYQDLFENAQDVVYTHDLSGNITNINKAGEELLGRDRKQMQQKKLLDFIGEEQRPAASQWLSHIVNGTAPETVEWDFETVNGSRVRLEISTRLIEHVGQGVEVEGIAREVTERRRLEKEILEISTREQRRIGHDLHDGVCQQLSGIALIADTLADKLEGQHSVDAAEAHKITELVNKANKQARGLARGLFPVQLEENGLVAALEELSENASAFSNTRCEFLCEGKVLVQEHIVARHLFYIAQEAILNAVKHGKATLIQMHLAPDGEDGNVLTIRDNGSGLAANHQNRQGMGIRIMKYRARMIGAEVEVVSRSGGGTEVVCRFSREFRR
jgi:PAS domain S-box-containing protein